MSQKRKEPPSDTTDQIFRSTPITDRQSTFKALYSPTLSARALQSLPEIRSADHRILGWRTPSRQQSIVPGKPKYETSHDDDGEKYGGKKVASVLEALDVGGACVVARWYGGVMLGPVRFAHMEACAQEAVLGFVEGEREQEGKRRKVEEERAVRERLVKALGERDGSIGVLRGLAKEKEDEVQRGILEGVKGLEGGGEVEGKEDDAKNKENGDDEKEKEKPAPPPATPSLDYSMMPLERLKALDKARDATISFLLKRIDKAEADITALKDREKPS